MPCHWCGDPHGVDQLCQRAQRGMSRRSFCFLFGAGIASALVAPCLSFSEDLTNVVTRVRPDASMQIVDQLGMPTVATFKTRDAGLRLGRAIVIEFQGQTLFAGNVAKTRRDKDGIEITALETLAFQDTRAPRSSPFSPLTPDTIPSFNS